ncbi:MAG: hypothetical protein WD696_11905 [Bryobacteraceae bacterium]
MSDAARAIPVIDDLALDYVTHARQRTVHRSLSLAIPGLAGDVQQVTGRASYEIDLTGVIVGDDAADKLKALQEKVAAGTEATFTADIANALELDKVLVVSAEFQERGGRPRYYDYRLLIRESPVLPPPAELSPFGGLDGFDLGFDTDLLGDIADLAGDLQNAIEQVAGALDTLQALAGLADLGLNNPLTPMVEAADSLGSAGEGGGDVAGRLSNLLGGGG